MFEYKVIPAPRRGQRTKTAKGTSGRFAYAMEVTLNELATDGWEYVRAESLPADERHGMMRKKVEEYHNVLIFRRATNATEEPAVIQTPARPFFAAPAPAPVAPKLGPAVLDTVDNSEPDVAIEDVQVGLKKPVDTPDDEPSLTKAKPAAKSAAKKPPAKPAAAKKKPAAKSK